MDTRQLLTITTIFFFTAACERNSLEKEKTQGLNPVTADSAVIPKDAIAKPDNLKIVKQFVEAFAPDTTTMTGFKKMNNFPENIVTSFKALRADRVNQERFLTLLYLKIYRGHLQCCHQSYELRRTVSGVIGIDSVADPLLYEYNLITKQVDSKKRIEMIGSGFAYAWLEQHKYLLSYDYIKVEYKIINKLKDNIKKGVYWK